MRKAPPRTSEAARGTAERAAQSDSDGERRVAEGARELTEADAELRRENDEWRRRERELREREQALGQAEAALREKEERTRSILDGIPGLVATLAADGSVEFVNRQIVEYTGQTLEELRDWTNGLFHPEDLPYFIEGFRRAIAAGTPYDIEQRMRRHDGTYRWFRCCGTPARDTEGRVLRWFVLVTDVDEKRQAEQALRASERALKQIIDTLPTTAWSTLPDGHCDFLNGRWLDYAGFTAERAEGWGWGAVIHPDDSKDLIEYWRGCLSAGTPLDTEARMRRYDGTYRWFIFRANPLRDEQGNIVKWYGTNIDIEDRKRAEEALDQLRNELAHISRVSSLGVLTASVAHEVSQPLSGIITNANTCLRTLASAPPNLDGAVESARRILRDANRAGEVVARLRALFLKRTEKSEAVDLNEAAAEVVALVANDLQRSRVAVRVEYAASLPRLTADRVQLQQVILNLLLNASDAMSGVTARPAVIVLTTAHSDEDVRLSVCDVGVGFGGPDPSRLFEAFYTTKSTGMGIGLSVSRSIIEGHGGRLWGEANRGPGATFSFSIPVTRVRGVQLGRAE